MTNRDKVIDTCPHCGRELSPWEQVLLSVDRALMCKGCWYRIVLDELESPESAGNKENLDNDSNSE